MVGEGLEKITAHCSDVFLVLREVLDGEVGVEVFHGREWSVGVCEAGVLEARKVVVVTSPRSSQS